MLQKLYVFFRKETVLSIAVILALLSMFWVRPDKAYFTYIDFRTLGLLFCLMARQKAEIVRVTKDIHAGELITKDMVTTAEAGSYNLPSGLMTTKNNVVGKYAKADLAVGD